MSNCGSDHRTNRERILSNSASNRFHRADDDDHRIHGVVLAHVERVNRMFPCAGLARDHLARDHGDQRQHKSVRHPSRFPAMPPAARSGPSACAAESPIAAPDHSIFSSPPWRRKTVIRSQARLTPEKNHQRFREITDASQSMMIGITPPSHRIDHHQQRIEEDDATARLRPINNPKRDQR